MIERAETMLHDSFGDIEHWEVSSKFYLILLDRGN